MVLHTLHEDQVEMRLRSLATCLALMSPSAVHAGDRAERLRNGVRALGDVRPELIDDAVEAAMVSETPDWSAEFLLGLAYQESRFEPRQQTGLVCGPMQVSPRDLEENDRFCGGSRLYTRMCWERAREQCHMWSQDMTLAFQAAVRELDWWLQRGGGSSRAALTGRACGHFRGCGKSWFIENIRCSETRIRAGRNDVCRYRRPPANN